MEKKKILFVGLVWPEPTSSAAGRRIIQLAEYFRSLDIEVQFACAAAKSDFSFPLTSLGIQEHAIRLNDSSFNDLLREIKPEMVLYDRFMCEEQYGWRVHQECPDALTILDTEDLHFLRQARIEVAKKGAHIAPYLYSEMAKREIAAILRVDLSLIISEAEITILEQKFRIDPSLLLYLPFLEQAISDKEIKEWNAFEKREGFAFIGNFLHEPNWKTVQQLKTNIWPVLKKKLPQATMHIYGSYVTQKAQQLHHEKDKFLVHGRVADARESLAKHRILLAPIPFGAGLKGKFIDAIYAGTPCATTSLGAEAMRGDQAWHGIIEDDPQAFIEQVIVLYTDKQTWKEAQRKGASLLNERYDKTKFYRLFTKRLDELASSLENHRERNFMGQLLHHHHQASTKYMSLWIEEKNKKNPNSSG